MRYLGIDYGAKRIGIALSDEGGNMAFPKTIITNTTSKIEQIKKICQAENVSTIIIGESLSYKGEPNEIMREIKSFARELAATTMLTVEFHPEILTTQEARRLDDATGSVDSRAAAIILQSYIDSKRVK